MGPRSLEVAATTLVMTKHVSFPLPARDPKALNKMNDMSAGSCCHRGFVTPFPAQNGCTLDPNRVQHGSWMRKDLIIHKTTVTVQRLSSDFTTASICLQDAMDAEFTNDLDIDLAIQNLQLEALCQARELARKDLVRGDVLSLGNISRVPISSVF